MSTIADEIVTSIHSAALQRAIVMVRQDVKNMLRKDQKVKFTTTEGIVVHGVIKRILRKNVEVHEPSTNTTWRVTPTVLAPE
jgi:hypothetical protein